MEPKHKPLGFDLDFAWYVVFYNNAGRHRWNGDQIIFPNAGVMVGVSGQLSYAECYVCDAVMRKVFATNIKHLMPCVIGPAAVRDKPGLTKRE